MSPMLNQFMALFTDSDNIKLMFFGVAIAMMILGCPLATLASERFRVRELAGSYGIVHAPPGAHLLDVLSPRFVTDSFSVIGKLVSLGARCLQHR